MTTSVSVTNRSWFNGIVSFTVSYSTNLYSENKLLEWSVNGVVKGSLTGGATSGGGTSQFNYSDSANSVIVSFKLYTFVGGTKGIYIPGENENNQFNKSVVPNAPVISSSNYNNNQNQILVSWSPVTDATAYNFEVWTPSFPNFNTLGGDSSSWETINGKLGIVYNLSTVGTYKFRLRAKNNIGYSNYSNELVTVYGTSGSTVLDNWTCPNLVKEDIPDNSMPLYSVKIKSATTTNVTIRIRNEYGYTDTTASIGALDGYCSSGYKFYDPFNLTLSTAPPETVPSPPELSYQQIDNTNYILSWTGETTNLFNLERATSTQNYSSVFGDLQDTDNQVNIALPDVTETYFYRLRTKNNVGYSNYSNVITINVTGTVIPPPVENPPNAPFISTSTYNNNPDQILVSWNPTTNATSYNLEVSTPDFPNFNSLGGDSSSWETINGKLGVVYNLSAFGTYQFRLRAKNSIGYSNYSNISTVTKEVVEPPPGETTQTVIQIQTPNNNNDIRGVLNPTNLQKWTTDNENGQLCNYPEFTGLNVPCSLTWFNTGAMVSEPDNFNSVISQIAQRYGGTGIAPKSTILQKAMGLTAIGFALSLLGSKR